MKTYPLADQLSAEDKKRLGFARGERGLAYNANTGAHTKKVVAVATGEYRSPLAGEWYLSGSIVEAYRAPNNLSSKFHICRLVRNQVATRRRPGSARRSKATK